MLILQTLARGKPLHGFEIAESIQQTSDEVLQVEEGSLYPALQRMLVKGWIAGDWGKTAENRRARFEYFLEDVFEAGIALQGTEVKSLRFGEGNIAESYAEVKGEQVWLVNSNIPEFSHGNRFNHEPKRPRKLLLHQREIARMHGAVERKGMTLVPLSIYFNSRGKAKVELALAKGKKTHDKRDTIKERDWKRDQQRIMKAHR